MTNHYYCVVLLLAAAIQAAFSTCTTAFTYRYIVLDCGFGTSYYSRRLNPGLINPRLHYFSIPETSTITCKNVTLLPLVHSYRDSYYRQSLHVVESTLPTLPHGAFANFSTIRKLFLNHLKIETVPPKAFDGLVNLEELRLDSNNITRITSLNALNQLKTLSLAHNSLRKLDLSAMHSLKVLNLTANGITGLAKIQLPHLDQLDLSENKIEDWFTLDADHIVLNGNSLTSLGTIGTGTISLQVRDNKIREVHLQRFELALRDLDLGFNRLTRLKAGQFLNMARLETLKLDHNSVTDVGRGALEGLYQLRELDLSFNAIKRFEPGTFDNLAKLQSIKVFHNPLIDRSGLSKVSSRLHYFDRSRPDLNWNNKDFTQDFK